MTALLTTLVLPTRGWSYWFRWLCSLRSTEPTELTLDFTQVAGHDAHASAMVLHMLQGLRHIGKKQVLVRNVKPDNILVEHVMGLGGSKRERFIPRFSDFGLSVDVSGKGDNLRKPVEGASGTELVGQLVGWWYDTQKVSPPTQSGPLEPLAPIRSNRELDRGAPIAC